MSENSRSQGFIPVVQNALPNNTKVGLNNEVRTVVNQPDIAKRLQDLDAEVSSGTPEQFAAFWKSENAKYRKLIAEARIEA